MVERGLTAVAGIVIVPSMGVSLSAAQPTPAPPTTSITSDAVDQQDPRYGTDGQGNPETDDCTISTEDDPQPAVDHASDGDVIGVAPAGYSDSTLSVDKAVTVLASGVVELRNIEISGNGATVDSFTVVGDALDGPSTGIEFSGSEHTIVNNLVNGKNLQYAIACNTDDCASDVLTSRNTVTQTNNFGVCLWGGSDITVQWTNFYELWCSDGNDDGDGMRIRGTAHVIRNNYVHDLNPCGGVEGPVLTFHSTVDGLDTTDIKMRNNMLVTAKGSTYADGSKEAFVDDTDNGELIDPSIRDDWHEFENNPDTPVRTGNPDDFTDFRAREQEGDIIDQGSEPNSPDFTAEVDEAPRVRGATIDIGPYEFE